MDALAHLISHRDDAPAADRLTGTVSRSSGHQAPVGSQSPLSDALKSVLILRTNAHIPSPRYAVIEAAKTPGPRRIGMAALAKSAIATSQNPIIRKIKGSGIPTPVIARLCEG